MRGAASLAVRAASHRAACSLSCRPCVPVPGSRSWVQARTRSRHLCSPTSATADPLPLQPLCERPRVHVASDSECEEFHRWATLRVQGLGPRGLSADGGPTQDELLRELRWLSEDAGLPDARFRGGPSSTSPPPALVSLRTSLADLKMAWEGRIADRVPFQYVTASAHWRDLVLVVGPGVLCPRPETERIVDSVEEFLETCEEGLLGLPWADLGTGTGALAIAIAQMRKTRAYFVPDELGGGVGVHAVDVSPAALHYAGVNVARHGLESSGAGGVCLYRGSWFTPLPGALRGKLAGIVSNPPYIPTSELAGLMPEVQRHEPRVALDGGRDGNEFVREIAREAVEWLAPGGLLMLEVAAGSAHGAAEALDEVSLLGPATTLEDEAGLPRFVCANLLLSR